ncbi:HDOD domain-containing protein [Comamonas composti]|uniref:HDOD domain-containing protein n=1 Tax=Comamonas composti TaxID=408558 RepID=UPI00042997B1|nr:HDOD domain-containing protein [Comamonas composti]
MQTQEPASDLQDLVEGPLFLPSQPRTVALLMNELACEVPSLRRLSQLFGKDPVLAGRLLALANTSAYKLQGQVMGIPEALVLLAPAQLRDIVGRAELGLGSRAAPSLDLHAFWRYSQETARLARALASAVQASPTAAYLAGLLHGLGLLVMHGSAPEQAARLAAWCDPLDPRRSEVERRLYGHAYSELSAALIESWQLPSLLVDALAQLHAPLAQAELEPLAGVLHLAVWRARSHQAGWDEKALAVSFPGEVGLALGLDIDMVLRQASFDWAPGLGPDVLL